VQAPTISAIENSTTEDMNAYSIALNEGGAAHVLKVLEPTPVNAEEDTGAMALFMDEVQDKTSTIDAPQ